MFYRVSQIMSQTMGASWKSIVGLRKQIDQEVISCWIENTVTGILKFQFMKIV